MCLTSKESALAFAALVSISVLLILRNHKYDMIMGILFIIVSLVQVIEYFYHKGCITSEFGGKALFMILWLQVLFLALSMYAEFKTKLTLIWSAIFVVIFGWAVYYTTFTDNTFSVHKGHGHLQWNQNGSNILGSMGFMYLIGLFVPFLIIEYYNKWKNPGIWILLGALILSAVVTRIIYPHAFASLWCYTAVFVAFVAWLIGAFSEK